MMIICRFIGLLCLVLLLGCSVAPRLKKANLIPGDGQSLLTVYLTASGSSLSDISYTLESVELYRDDVWLGLDFEPLRVSREANRNQQLLVGVALAPAGEQRRIRLRISNLKIAGKLLSGVETAHDVEMVLAEPLLLEGRESRCLFVDWALVAGQGAQQSILPTFTAKGQSRPLGAGLVYVACDDINTVYILRGDTNEVVASFAVPGSLGEIRVDQHARRLYILSTGQRKLYVYDCVKSRYIEQIVLPGTIAPKHMVLSSDGESAYVSDAISGQILRVDLVAGVVTVQQRLSHKPENLTFFTSGSDRLAVVAPSAQKIYMLGSESLNVLSNFSVGMRPSAIEFFAGALYVAEQATNMVAAYEHQTGRLLERIPVGLLPTDLLAVAGRQLWVANAGSASISVLHAGQNAALRRIKTASAPSAMESFADRNLLYVTSHKKNQLSVLELTSGRIRKAVALAGSPRAVAVLE